MHAALTMFNLFLTVLKSGGKDVGVEIFFKYDGKLVEERGSL